VSLEDLVEREKVVSGIPAALQYAILFLRQEKNIKEEGLFRISTAQSSLDALQKAMDSECEKEEIYLGHCPDTVASFTKLMLRSLPIPLFTYVLYSSFLAVTEIADVKSKLVKIKSLIATLPPVHYNVAYCLVEFLKEVGSYSEHNKMTHENLSVIFGPILLRSSESDFDQLLQESHLTSSIFLLILKNFSTLFSSPPSLIDLSKL